MHRPDTPRDAPSAPPGVWAPAHDLVRRALAPVERFLAIEASSGILLVLAAVLAMAWANSPWSETYVRLWHTPFGMSLGGLSFERDLHFWINDALMTVFFFVVGLEIRREIHGGELADLRRAALPLAAAAGGMIAPALIYVGLNHGHASSRGWGIPMATDIAFAVGALTLLGKRVIPAQRILLLALAVIDDVGAILVIALFYSSGVSATGFAVAAAGVAVVLAMRALGVRSPWAYVPPGAIVWAGFLLSGVHPTLAGVVLGLLTPADVWEGDAFNAGRREAVSPVERVQRALHGWVAFGIMPLFALANAGVPVGDASLAGDGWLVFLGIALGLLLGKPIGIVALSWVLVRLGVSSLPSGVGWRRVGVVGSVGGIGFTMALFIAQLAFPTGALLEVAKIAVLAGSAGAALGSVILGRLLTGERSGAAATSESEAEASTTH